MTDTPAPDPLAEAITQGEAAIRAAVWVAQIGAPHLDLLVASARALVTVQDMHVIGYRNGDDLMHNRNRVCEECRLPWPCETAQVIAANRLEADRG